MKVPRFRACVCFLLSMVGSASLQAQTSAALPQEMPSQSNGSTTGQPIDPDDHRRGLRGSMEWSEVLSISPDGRFFVTTNHDRQQFVREVVNGKPIAELPKGILQAIFSPDAKTVACQLAENPNENVPRGWQIPHGWQLFTTADARPVGLEFALTKPEEHLLYTVFFSPDGKLLAGFSGKERVAGSGATERIKMNLWDAATGKRLARQPAEEFNGYVSARFSPNGKILVGFGSGNVVLLWSVPRLKPLWAFPLGTEFFAGEAAFSTDSKLLTVNGTDVRRESGKDNYLSINQLYKVTTGKLVAKPDSEYPILFVSGDHAFVTASDKGVQAWSLADGKLLAALPGVGCPITVSPDGKTLVVKQGDDLQLYDTIHWSAGVIIAHGAVFHGTMSSTSDSGLPFEPVVFDLSSKTWIGLWLFS